MSASIPIPNATPNNRVSASNSPSNTLGQSLPNRANRTFHDPSTRPRQPSLLASQDDLATISWPPRPSVELVSRSAKKWQSGRYKSVNTQKLAKKKINRFDPWDFSEVVNATDEVRTAFQTGLARAERPDREGVCGTYFIRRNESKGAVLCVFKPVDEEAREINMSPTMIPMGHALSSSPIESSMSFSLGPAHGSTTPLAQSPDVGYSLARSGSLSSDSDSDSRSGRASGFHSGEGAYKEVAAYLLDHGRFAGVPQTALAKCNFSSDLPKKDVRVNNTSSSIINNINYEKENDNNSDDNSHHRTRMGAFQVYVPNVGDADDFGPGVFDVDQVHRIAVLDIRTLNHDRHGGNLLVTKSESIDRRYDLVPIDHGYILPEFISSIPWPIWMDWPMIRKPISDEIKNYIEELDADREANRLDDELDGKLRQGSLQALKISTALLQKGIAAGLTLYDIGLLMYTRPDEPYTKTELEKIVAEAEEAALARQHTFDQQHLSTSPSVPEDAHHRRHQSMSSLNTLDWCIEDYIVKYAKRQIQILVTAVAKEKEKAAKKNKSNKPGIGRHPHLHRTRSIPDFGIGVKPIHALLNIPSSASAYAPTPVSSPVTGDSRKMSAMDRLESELPVLSEQTVRREPIQIPINDGSIRRIAIPEPRPVVPITTNTFSNNTNGNVNPNNIPKEGSTGHFNSGNLPPLFGKSTMRKSSPVAPLDVLMWETGSS